MADYLYRRIQVAPDLEGLTNDHVLVRASPFADDPDSYSAYHISGFNRLDGRGYWSEKALLCQELPSVEAIAIAKKEAEANKIALYVETREHGTFIMQHPEVWEPEPMD